MKFRNNELFDARGILTQALTGNLQFISLGLICAILPPYFLVELQNGAIIHVGVISPIYF